MGFRRRGPSETARAHLAADTIQVTRPGVRWEVLLCLADFGELTFQLREWTNGGGTEENPWDTFDETVNLLGDLAPSPPTATVRWVLVDGPEVGRIRRLWLVLNVLLDELGDVEFEEYLRHPRWLEVVRAARAALCAMVIAGPFEVEDTWEGAVVDVVDDPEGRWEVLGAVARLADREYQERVWVRGRAWQACDPLASFGQTVAALRGNRVLPEPSDAVPGVLVDGPQVARLRELGQALAVFLEGNSDVPFAQRIREPAWGDVIDRAWSSLYEMASQWPIRSAET